MFSTNKGLIEKAHDTLAEMTPPSPEMGDLVREGLRCMLRAAPLFDTHVSCDTPFTKHFLELLTSLPFKDEGDWYGLFEDITLFVREKKLRSPNLALEDGEQRILKHFESCHEWAPEDGLLVSFWYWYRLPLKVLHENSRDRHYLFSC